MAKKFNTQYERPIKDVALEKVDDKSRVETAGYLTAEQRISSLIGAGQRLVDYRRQQFDTNEEEPPEYLEPDPTRAPNFDLADSTMIANQLKYNASERAKAQRAEEQRIASQTAQEALKATSGAIEG